MNENKSWSSMGQDIRDAVQKALRDGDFGSLSDVAFQTVNDTIKNVSSMVEQAVSKENNAERTAGAERDRARQYNNTIRNRVWQQTGRGYAESAAPIKKIAAVPFVPVGRVSSVLYKVFGGVFTGVTAILSVVFGGLGFGLSSGFFAAAEVMTVFLAGSVAAIYTGIRQSDRLKRAKKVVELVGYNHYINVEDIALHTNRTPKKVRGDIKKMLAKGFFPEGHLDAQENCLMLSDKIYREYLALEKQRRIQEQEQKAIEAKKASKPKRDTESKDASKPQTDAEKDELNDMIAKGQDCVRKLREMNDNIPGEEISAKLFRLETLLKEIFDRLKEHPEQQPQMQKFINYYLPTTLKLVAAYEDFDAMSVQGAEVLEAKAEIEKTLDTINSAFGELLNRLFQETAFDVTTDAQVLQTMLAKEGLTNQIELEKAPK